MENNEKRHTSINRDAEDVTPDHQQSAGDGSATSKDPPPRPKKRKYVEKGTLTEEQLMEEKMRARSSKRSSQKTEEEKREERRAANRLSAFQSRQRRLNTIDELQVRKRIVVIFL